MTPTDIEKYLKVGCVVRLDSDKDTYVYEVESIDLHRIGFLFHTVGNVSRYTDSISRINTILSWPIPDVIEYGYVQVRRGNITAGNRPSGWNDQGGMDYLPGTWQKVLKSSSEYRNKFIIENTNPKFKGRYSTWTLDKKDIAAWRPLSPHTGGLLSPDFKSTTVSDIGFFPTTEHATLKPLEENMLNQPPTDVSDFKPENLAAAKEIIDKERKTHEIETAKAEYLRLVNKRDDLDRQAAAIKKERDDVEKRLKLFEGK